MSLESNIIKENPSWIEEIYFFGSAETPREATYRKNGERIQYRMELNLPLLKNNPESKTYSTESHNKSRWGYAVEDFLLKYQDCEFQVREGNIATSGNGKFVPPSLYLIGWEEIRTSVERQQYEQDKKEGHRLK